MTRGQRYRLNITYTNGNTASITLPRLDNAVWRVVSGYSRFFITTIDSKIYQPHVAEVLEFLPELTLALPRLKLELTSWFDASTVIYDMTISCDKVHTLKVDCDREEPKQ